MKAQKDWGYVGYQFKMWFLFSLLLMVVLKEYFSKHL